MVDATQLCLSCHCTHGGCYATVFVLNLHVGWGGVGWGWWHSLNLNTWWMLRNSVCLVTAHMVDATQLCLSCHLHTRWTPRNCVWTWTHGGCYATLFVLSLHTWWALRNCVLSCHCTHGGCYESWKLCLSWHLHHGVGWGGDDDILWTWTTWLWDAMSTQFVYRHNKDLWETTWRSKTTFCVVVHISRTSYKNRKTSDCVVNNMILDYANVWHHRASRRRVTLFLEYIAACHCMQLWWSTSQHIYATGTRTHSIYVH